VLAVAFFLHLTPPLIALEFQQDFTDINRVLQRLLRKHFDNRPQSSPVAHIDPHEVHD
jgi:hypothetical protein